MPVKRDDVNFPREELKKLGKTQTKILAKNGEKNKRRRNASILYVNFTAEMDRWEKERRQLGKRGGLLYRERMRRI